MRKKLDTRFPAARIKKIMQADEDIGKIAMAVPLLVSKALELFLQDLCDRTYEITLKRGAKTVNSLHLKQCVQSFNEFDFLKDTVSKVPDLGGSDAASEDRSASRRRKVPEDEEDGNDEESKRVRLNEAAQPTTSPRGRGRGRGRGRPRINRTVERDPVGHSDKFEDDPDISLHNDEKEKGVESIDNIFGDTDSKHIVGSEASKSVRNFDLNVDLNDSGECAPMLAGSSSDTLRKPSIEMKHEDIPGWSLDDMEKIAMDPVQLANLNKTIEEEDEDYDEEG